MNYTVRAGEEIFNITAINAGAGTAKLNGQTMQVDLRHVRGRLYHLILNGEAFAVHFSADQREVTLGPHSFPIEIEDERSAAIKKLHKAPSANETTSLKAPMPGLIVRVDVRAGEVVKKGQGLLVIEAMKMENEIKSPRAGTVTEIMVAPRSTVEKGAPLLLLKPSS